MDKKADLKSPPVPMTGRYEQVWTNLPDLGVQTRLTMVADYWSTFGPIEDPVDYHAGSSSPSSLADHYIERGAYFVRVYARDEDYGSTRVFTTLRRTPLS